MKTIPDFGLLKKIFLKKNWGDLEVWGNINLRKIYDFLFNRREKNEESPFVYLQLFCNKPGKNICKKVR